MDLGRALGSIDTIADWSRVFRDGDVWYPLVRAVLARHGLAGQWRRPDVWPGQVAGTHAVFVVAGRLVVKFYGPFWPNDYRQEAAVLRRLAGHPRLLGGVRLPELIASGEVGDAARSAEIRRLPYLVTSYLPGRQLGEVWPGLAADQRQRLAGELGQALAELHNVKPEGLDGAGPSPGGGSARMRREAWAEFVASQASDAQARHSAWGTLPAHLLADLPGFLAGERPLPRDGWRPALLHCDVTAEHVLVDRGPAGWRLAGLIDFGDAMVGDPEYEFPVIGLSALAMDRAALCAFLREYGYLASTGTALARRMMAYALLHVFPILKDLPAAIAEQAWSRPTLAEAAVAVWGQGP
jgi:hygromycin-B 7''-O-kinase